MLKFKKILKYICIIMILVISLIIAYLLQKAFVVWIIRDQLNIIK